MNKQTTRPVAIIQSNNSDPCILLTIGGDLVGAWRAKCFETACEVLKPLAENGVIGVICKDDESKDTWSKIKTFQNVAHELFSQKADHADYE